MNKRNYAALERCGQALYDKHNWKKSLERRLKLKTGAIDKWSKTCEKWPDFEINRDGNLWPEIFAMLKQKKIDIDQVLSEIE